MIVSSPLVLEDHLIASHPQVNNLSNLVRDFRRRGHSTQGTLFSEIASTMEVYPTLSLFALQYFPGKGHALILPCDVHSHLVFPQGTGFILN